MKITALAAIAVAAVAGRDTLLGEPCDKKATATCATGLCCATNVKRTSANNAVLPNTCFNSTLTTFTDTTNPPVVLGGA